MPAYKLDLEIEQGATFEKTITWKAGTPAVAVNLTGCSARMQVRERMDAVAVLLNLTTTNGGITLDGILGTVTLLASALQTGALTKHTGVYDLEIQFSDGTVKRLIYGAVSIAHKVTRA